MKFNLFKLTASIVLTAAASVALAETWYHAPPNTPFFPSGVDPSKVSVIDNYSWNQENTTTPAQWSDVFYPNTPDGWSGAMINKAACVYVHYHGGGWTSNDPRDSILPVNERSAILASVVKRFAAPSTAGGLNCIVVTMSYPLSNFDSAGNLLNSPDGPSTVIGQPVTLNKIIGDISVQGSVYWTFNKFYVDHFAKWKISNPALQLYVGGYSAGAYIAQRVATSGKWPVTSSLLLGPPILNPSSVDPTMVSRLYSNGNTLENKNCEKAMQAVHCNVYKNLYGNINGQYNNNDLKNYYLNPSLQMTYVVSNVCDNITDLGSVVNGWFKTLPTTKRQLYVHVGFGDLPNTTGTSHGHFGAMYTDFFTTGAPGLPNGSNWLVNGVTDYLPRNGSDNNGYQYPLFASNCNDPESSIKKSIQN